MIHQVSTTGYGQETRDKVLAMEACMRQMPQVEIEPRHTFAQGLYAREILIPAGTLLTGKVHRQDDLQILVYGTIDMVTEEGTRRVSGPLSWRGKAGGKQCGLAHTDCLWITVHQTDETDMDLLEALLYEDEPAVIDYRTGKVLPGVLAASHEPIAQEEVVWPQLSQQS